MQLEVFPSQGITMTINGILDILPMSEITNNFTPYLKVTFLPDVAETFESNVIYKKRESKIKQVLLAVKNYEETIEIKFPKIEIFNTLERSILIQVLNYHKSATQTIICENQVSVLDFNWESSDIHEISLLLCPSYEIHIKDAPKLKYRKVVREYGEIVLTAKYNIVLEKLYLTVVRCRNLNTHGAEKYGNLVLKTLKSGRNTVSNQFNFGGWCYSSIQNRIQKLRQKPLLQQVVHF